MAIISTDLKYYLSGGAANADPILSLGGIKSTTIMPVGIFDDVSSAEAGTGRIEYRCIYLNNNHATLSLLGAKLWIQTNTPSADTDIAIGLGLAGLNGTEATVANEITAPASVVFSSPASFAGGLTMGDIPATQRYGIWIRRTVNAGAVAVADSFTLRVQGDTNP